MNKWPPKMKCITMATPNMPPLIRELGKLIQEMAFSEEGCLPIKTCVISLLNYVDDILGYKTFISLFGLLFSFNFAIKLIYKKANPFFPVDIRNYKYTYIYIYGVHI